MASMEEKLIKLEAGLQALIKDNKTKMDSSLTHVKNKLLKKMEALDKHKSEAMEKLENRIKTLELENHKLKEEVISLKAEVLASKELKEKGEIQEVDKVVIKEEITKELTMTMEIKMEATKEGWVDVERKERLDRLRENASTVGSGSSVTSSVSEKCAVNIARDVDEEEVLIPSGIAKFLKPHQIEGVQFMWENCIESIKKVKAGDPGNGCIVAHSMGLGKTLQVIAFLYTVLKRKDLGLRTALIVTPVNVLHNWPDEFEKWTPVETKNIHVYVLDETSRHTRRKLLCEWQRFGGVMMIGYSTFRTLSLGKYVKDALEKEDICKALQVILYINFTS
ncbi:hypothetical protein L7F22_010488 [Adiantum nelumboides]|nr:hypothetical protein [Adiantum nelumboides]